MPRVYERKFDWDEARRLRAEGLTYAEIGQRCGVSGAAVYLACNEEPRRLAQERSSAWQKAARCTDCGGPASRNRSRHRSETPSRCLRCAGRARRVRYRYNADGTVSEVRCSGCGEWKDAHSWPRNRSAAGGFHTRCRDCNTKEKRDYRRRNRTPVAA